MDWVGLGRWIGCRPTVMLRERYLDAWNAFQTCYWRLISGMRDVVDMIFFSSDMTQIFCMTMPRPRAQQPPGEVCKSA